MPRENPFGLGKKFTYFGLAWLVAATVAVPSGHAGESDEMVSGKSKVEQTSSAATEAHPVRIAMDQSYLGNAPYICTPSGFGNKARCFLRASVHSHR